MEFKDRNDRKECYKHRDAYFECSEKQGAGADACKDLFKVFEKTCGSKWTEHFIRRREYLKFKARLEKEGSDSIDKQKIK